MAWKSVLATLILTASLLWGPSANAAQTGQIQKHFQPLSGYVVDTVEGHVLIDFGKSSPVSPGDLFTISTRGKEIVHPVDKKVLGHVKSVQALLQVVKVEEAFSYTQPLMGAENVQAGQSVRRFGHMKAVFWDYTGRDETLYQDLTAAAPHLLWKNFHQSQKAKPDQPGPLSGHPATQLYFVKKAGKLEVRGPYFSLIHAYPLDGGKAAEPPAPGTEKRAQAAAPRQDIQGHEVAYQETFSQLHTIASLEEPVVMADFLSGSGARLMAFSNGKSISVAAVGTELKRQASARPDYPGRVLSLSWWAPGDDDRLYVVANIWYNRSIQSAVFVYSEKGLSCVQERMSKLLSAFDTDGDQMPETLLAQQYDANTIFGRRIWEGRLADGAIQWAQTDIALPRQFRVTGSTLADVTGDGAVEIIFIKKNTLFIYDHNHQALYKSSVQVGGSQSSLLYKPDTSAQNAVSNSVVFELSPLARDIDHDGIPEIVLPACQQGFLGSITGQGDTAQSKILVLDYRQNRFGQGSLGGFVDGSIQGLTIADATAYLVSLQKSGSFSGNGRSLVASFPLELK